jgi:hypothetical protein
VGWGRQVGDDLPHVKAVDIGVSMAWTAVSVDVSKMEVAQWFLGGRTVC